MTDLTFVLSDTAPSLFGALTRSDGTVYDLTDATVRFQMRLGMDRRFSVDSPAVVVEAAAGRVRYDWAPGDLSLVGDFVVRWQITFEDGSIEHTDPTNTVAVATP